MDHNKLLLSLPVGSRVLITWDYRGRDGLTYEVARIRDKTEHSVDLLDEDGIGFNFPLIDSAIKKVEPLTPELEAAIRMDIIKTEVT